jgi:hypothetical protein
MDAWVLPQDGRKQGRAAARHTGDEMKGLRHAVNQTNDVPACQTANAAGSARAS